jgi:hypothetical protein
MTGAQFEIRIDGQLPRLTARTTPSTLADGTLAASIRPRRSRRSTLVQVANVNGPMTCADRVATLEEAKAQFQKSWDA